MMICLGKKRRRDCVWIWLVCLLLQVIRSGAQGDDAETTDDDDVQMMMAKDISGWHYPTPKAEDPPHHVSDGAFPFVFWDAETLNDNKQHMDEYDHAFQHGLWYLKKSADRFVQNKTLLSVVKKSRIAPSNDSHDYLSLARYYWPNKRQSQGLPYIRQDGKVNPEIRKVPDYELFRALVKQVHYLSLAYHFFDNETYAESATTKIRAWFMDPATRMNPHLQYASLVRGYNVGRAKGIIDFHVVMELLDGISVLQYSKAWQPGMNAYLRHWFSLYVEWLTESPNGIFEARSHNNHGTYYDIQRAAIYIFLHQHELARQVIANATAARIAQQILTSGEQYQETSRRMSWFYSVFNLRGLFQLAMLGERLNVDLFHYETVDGKSIRRALDYLLPFATNESAWEFKNTGGFEASNELAQLLDVAAIKYGDKRYSVVRKEIVNRYPQRYNITQLTLPWQYRADFESVKPNNIRASLALHLTPSLFHGGLVLMVIFALVGMPLQF